MLIKTATVNGSTLIEHLKNTLNQRDPDYAKEYSAFTRAEAQLADNSFTNTLESAFSAKLLYIAWQGACWNLECWHVPASKLRLQSDYEELHGESRFSSLPQIQACEKAICAAIRQFPPDRQELAMEIQDFYAYLETAGFKLAHYWGFQWGNTFFQEVIPGYLPDIHFTAKYMHMLEQDLGMILMDPA